MPIPPRKVIMSLSILLVLTLVAAVLFFRSAPQTPEQAAQQTQAPGIPAEWPQIQALLEQNALPAIHIKLLDEKPVRAYQSKFGGQAWWPAGKPYPTGKNGQPLVFLAQINFSELNGQLVDYPATGLLQFFIGSDDLYGMDFIDKSLPLERYLTMKKNFAVIYHREVDASAPTRSAPLLATSADDLLPHRGETAITLSLGRDIANPADYRFRKILAPLGDLSEAADEYAFETLGQSPSHKLGGYAAFTQEDPRGYEGKSEEWLLLFQMDTDSNERFEIMWGDVGIANFFIRRADLKALDFDKVWYNWDCH
ncbi:DUF1963 domain-containing protein [Uliginosibacterium sp. 31-16]|uniref:YwqG family protein n=1 Tax=Uliginosibacterium sp. 31-16 TaxID=3068315 RepID=UPI00273E9C0F|nr:DUF1963 domain-containing protein [Uliginosibacterium sp. 31-16]MDP5238854.1 DUF1963 domain-containing protein [Uliginosibacterium sp. 31-16]